MTSRELALLDRFQLLRQAQEKLSATGWSVEQVFALTLPDPSRVVGFQAWHPRLGKRLFRESLDELVSVVGRFDAGEAVSPS